MAAATTATYLCYWCDVEWHDLPLDTYECSKCARTLREKADTRQILSPEEAEHRALIRFFFGPSHHTGLRAAPTSTIPRPTCYTAPNKK